MIQDKVCWFDISMNDIRIIMAVIKSSQHIDEVKTDLRWLKPPPNVLIFILKKFTQLLLFRFNQIFNTTFRVVFSDQVHVVLIVVIYDRVQPYNIGVLQFLEHLELANNAIVGRHTVDNFTFEFFLVHLFQGIFEACFGVDA